MDAVFIVSFDPKDIMYRVLARETSLEVEQKMVGVFSYLRPTMDSVVRLLREQAWKDCR